MTSATTGSGSTGKPAGFMSEYMSDLSQSQDLNSFLRENQPTYNRNSSSSSPSASTDTTTPSSSSSTASAEPSSSSSKTPPSSGSDTGKYHDPQASVGTRSLPNAHAVYQKQAIHQAALDNCADYNIELTNCLTGVSGSWWDRASMCMKAKEQFQRCCRLNREALQEKGFANEGNTPEQDRFIQDSVDDFAQKAMKEEGKA
ncbi:MAG: hypothetical protein J3Q66DRAFT_329360 [Benniella sp.]|nr:MAG: hypothetical protein J3Q66DRAFT_329360 [Benniella sp.]